jgi:uncharacterized membrane protein YeaQ/YmgE (transglycosylase-associated protein family)
LLNVAVGVVGAVIGGWIMSFFGKRDGGGFDLYSFAVALLGAVIFIWIIRALRR